MLRSPRLFLRPLSLSDAPALLPIFHDAETMRYWSHAPVASIDEMQSRIEHNLSSDGPPNAFAITESEEGHALGWVDLYSFKNGNAGAGYILGKSARGKGYAREALAAVLDYAFGARALHRIYLDIDPENSASIRLAQSMNFRWEGHFKSNFFRDGEYFDSVYYAMLAREWRALKGSA
jgi:[ribosomal protein S5]-alanine N-acetyltransferase